MTAGARPKVCGECEWYLAHLKATGFHGDLYNCVPYKIRVKATTKAFDCPRGSTGTKAPEPPAQLDLDDRRHG
jgi:hypothetical protein